jgi:transposase-like protein
MSLTMTDDGRGKPASTGRSRSGGGNRQQLCATSQVPADQLTALIIEVHRALAGLVEVDETELPCRSKNGPLIGGRGRSRQGKILVVGAVEVQDGGAGPGRVRLKEIPDYSAASLHAFLATDLAPGATVKTDGLSSYAGAPNVHHDPHVVGKMAAHIVLPWVHRVFSNLKVWALGVYHGLRRKHLQSYLDEFVFRFNRRRTRHAAFRALLGIGPAMHLSATRC